MERRVKEAARIYPWRPYYFDKQGVDWWWTPVHTWRPRFTQLSRWRKRHPLDCGDTRCCTCHYDKFYAPKARNNKRRAAIRFELEAE